MPPLNANPAFSRRLFCPVAALVLALGLAAPAARAQAQAPAANSEAAREAELHAALDAGYKAGTRGPATVKLLDEATLALPPNEIFIPTAEGTRILRALGNTINNGTSYQGIVLGTTPSDGWIVVVRYIKEGYIKDDDAKSWNADELLQNLKDGNEEANKDRAARGFPQVEIIGWIEKPTYDAVTHRLVWSLSSKHKGEPAGANTGVNYNTYALGRDGYFSLNLLTNSSSIGADKAVAHELLAALDYNSGRRYEDFNASTDHIATYGIIALVGGIAAKKLGLLALIGAFVLKFAKVIFLGVAAFLGGVYKLFGRKKTQT
ncbi:MAG TPA: DUF2167 domain-containing protein [Xanthobacteraceae bacterium]|nr:DUF2167 domain-containing protein [Xanthobacteraceae bacterium]